MSSSLMASQITIPAAAFHHRLCAPIRRTRLPPPIRAISFSPNRKPYKLRITAAITPSALPTRPINSALSKKRPINSANQNGQSQDLISGLTRTVTTLFAVAVAAAKLFGNGIFNLAVQLKEPLLTTAGPAFFAAARDAPSDLNTPLTVVAAGMAKWLDLYSGVLMVRVLLSWFPNIPWDRQPMSAIRDLCDPYLNLFRNIIPPIFDTLDVSPILAFAVLGTLASILNSTRGY